MSRLLLKKCFFILLASLSVCRLGAQRPPYEIDSIKAFLYYNSNKSVSDTNVIGAFSENLIDNKEITLWNTPIGSGDAAGNSNQTFVVVQIKGNPEKYTERTVRLTAYQNNRQVFQQSQRFDILDDMVGYAAAFLLYNTGCDKIKLKAEILNISIVSGKKRSKTESSMIKSIPFACGE
jgi:hypothetical protein